MVAGASQSQTNSVHLPAVRSFRLMTASLPGLAEDTKGGFGTVETGLAVKDGNV